MKTDEHLYTLTRTEFAKEIGKSREAVKIGMRRGKYKDLYIFKDGKYFLKAETEWVQNRICPPFLCTQQNVKLDVVDTKPL